ncbi:hypothetical protein BC833DRAFT_292245 [Globomyces pollinis-pini]|nr:hypothetical protein BC833DRAFT_292245 [Globomyces pollinis-pini]
MNSEDCKKVWDILFVTNLAFLTSVKQQTNVKLLDYNDHTEYEILTIQSDILLLGFLPNLDASYSLKLVELSLNNCIQLLHTSKRLHINWMIYNCGALFWKLFCLFHEKNPSELWAEGATKLYELFSELSMKNSSLFVLLSMAFATGQIEQYQATISKATATNSKLNKDMLNLFLKNAEESIKQAATIKESDLVSSMTIIPIWNKIHQLKGENKANLVIPLLEFDDPALKLLAASDAPATNNQPKSVPKDLESIETQFLAIHWLPNLPFVHKIKNYLKLAKQLTELSSQYVMAMGLYHKCFQFLAKASQIPNLNAIETSWCLILRIDLFNSYFGMMKTISKEYHAESITNLCTTFKKFGLNTSMMKDFFQAILTCFWNYQSVYLTVDNTYATFENMSKFLGQIYRFYQNCRAFKQMIDNSLTPTDYNIMTELYLAWGSACIDNDQQKIAIQINQMALAVLPLKLQGKLWARHCFLLQDSETNIQEILHPSFTLTWRDQLEIARAITTKNRKKEFLEAYRMMKMENLGDSQISEYCIEFFHEGFTDEELGIPKTALNIEEQPRLVFLEVHRISRRIKEALK